MALFGAARLHRLDHGRGDLVRVTCAGRIEGRRLLLGIAASFCSLRYFRRPKSHGNLDESFGITDFGGGKGRLKLAWGDVARFAHSDCPGNVADGQGEERGYGHHILALRLVIEGVPDPACDRAPEWTEVVDVELERIELDDVEGSPLRDVNPGRAGRPIHDHVCKFARSAHET